MAAQSFSIAMEPQIITRSVSELIRGWWHQTAKQWLDLPNVVCIGGSWLAPKNLVQSHQWEVITALAQQATQLTA